MAINSFSIPQSFGAVGGPPLAGFIQAKYGGFEGVGLYSGGVVVVACILLGITRRLALGKWAGKC